MVNIFIIRWEAEAEALRVVQGHYRSYKRAAYSSAWFFEWTTLRGGLLQ